MDHTRHIHERFLRHIWSRQYLEQSRLRTTDGRVVKVLDVGKLNLEGGPDFSDAKIRIGHTTYAGDVEIHRSVQDWYQHRHQEDPHYNKVILHVVLEDSRTLSLTTTIAGRAVPLLILSRFLSESIQSIWQRAILDERARRAETIRCSGDNNAISDSALLLWLRRLATERLELKLRRFEERLKELTYQQLMTVRESSKRYGEHPQEGNPDEIPPPLKELTQKDLSKKEAWQQVLYEGLMEGLGYAKNQEPFLRLSRNVTLQLVRDLGIAGDALRREALLFAIAGLLPKIKSLNSRESKDHVRRLIRVWHEMRSSVRVARLHASDWQFFPTRPTNFPTLRISAANLLIGKMLNEDLFRAVIQTLKTFSGPSETRRKMIQLLSLPTEGFWRNHYDFDQTTKTPIVPLGTARINELLINTVIPIALLYARIFKDMVVRERTLAFYDSFPSPGENSVTRLMEHQLIKNRTLPRSASRQQGLIQLYKFYCTEGRCPECEIGRIVFHS